MWYRKSLVPNPPKTYDEMISMAQQLKAQGKPYEIGFTAAQYEGYVVNVNNLVTAYGGTLVNTDSTASTVDDKTVQALALLHKLATSGVTSSSLSNAQEPEVFADLEAGRSAISLNWPYVLSAMRTAKPDLVNDLGLRPVPLGERRYAEGDARRYELRDQYLQQAPERVVRGGDVHAQREERAQRRAGQR